MTYLLILTVIILLLIVGILLLIVGTVWLAKCVDAELVGPPVAVTVAVALMGFGPVAALRVDHEVFTKLEGYVLTKTPTALYVSAGDREFKTQSAYLYTNANSSNLWLRININAYGLETGVPELVIK